MKYYNPKDKKIHEEVIYLYQRDFFALYGENEVLGNQTISIQMNWKECGSDATDCTFVSKVTSHCLNADGVEYLPNCI